MLPSVWACTLYAAVGLLQIVAALLVSKRLALGKPSQTSTRHAVAALHLSSAGSGGGRRRPECSFRTAMVRSCAPVPPSAPEGRRSTAIFVLFPLACFLTCSPESLCCERLLAGRAAAHQVATTHRGQVPHVVLPAPAPLLAHAGRLGRSDRRAQNPRRGTACRLREPRPASDCGVSLQARPLLLSQLFGSHGGRRASVAGRSSTVSMPEQSAARSCRQGPSLRHIFRPRFLAVPASLSFPPHAAAWRGSRERSRP